MSEGAALPLWKRSALPVLVLLACVAAVFYWAARRCGVISDAWELLHIASLGLPEALFVPLSYHVIPVTLLITTIHWKVFGLWEPGYQIVNLGELVLSAWLVYFFGLRLFGRPLVALLAALLLLTNASFYEVTCWPVIGNFQIAAGLLQLGGLFAVDRAVRSTRPAPWAGLFGLCAVLAFFTYEPAISLLPAGVLYAALVPPPGGDRSWRQMWRRAAPLLVASALAFLPMIAAKIHAASSGQTALFLPENLDAVRTRLHFLIRGCIGIFTLRGSDGAAYFWFYPGGFPPAWGSSYHHVLIFGWLGLMGVLTLLALFRSREPAVPFLALWFWLYVAIVSVATTLTSRQYYLAAIPAALLSAWAIFRVADAAGRAFSRRDPATLAATLAFLAFALLAAGAKSDINDVADLHRQATQASRRLRELMIHRASSGPLDEVAILNLPGRIVRNGMGAYAFVNGTRPMAKLATNGLVAWDKVFFYTTSSPVAPGAWASGTRSITLADLDRKIDDPRRLVLWFDPRSRTMVELSRTNWTVPREITAAAIPFLHWEEGSWPWFRAHQAQTLDLPLKVGADSWVALKFARGKPPVSFEVFEGGVPRLRVRGQAGLPPIWPVAVFPVSAGAGIKTLTFRPEMDVWIAGLWPLEPQERYTPATSPFLNWWMKTDPTLVIDQTLRLPLATRHCPAAGCATTLEYLAEPGRDFSVSVEGSERRDVVIPAGAPTAWRTVTLSTGAVEAGAPAVLRLEPRGAKPLLLHGITTGVKPASSAPAPETGSLVLETSTGGSQG